MIYSDERKSEDETSVVRVIVWRWTEQPLSFKVACYWRNKRGPQASHHDFSDLQEAMGFAVGWMAKKAA